MFCEQCGFEIKETDKFCEKCGHAISSDSVADATGVQATEPIQQNPQQVYYGTQTQVVEQNPKKGFNFFHFFVGASILIFGIAFIVIAMSFMKQMQAGQPTAEQMQAQADAQAEAEAANAAAVQEQQLFNGIYSLYCRSYELEQVRTNGRWEAYNTLGEVAGAILDFRNYYEFGSQTQTYTAPSITLSMESIDLTALELGVHSISEFYYEEISGMDFFIDDVHGFAIFSDGTYLYIGFLNAEGAWQGEYAFQ
uniref:zinc-ribbon domain-containing protein n=1 Tax=Acetatifactor sp. TaxID=1872090 RepID=UPI004057911E